MVSDKGAESLFTVSTVSISMSAVYETPSFSPSYTSQIIILNFLFRFQHIWRFDIPQYHKEWRCAWYQLSINNLSYPHRPFLCSIITYKSNKFFFTISVKRFRLYQIIPLIVTRNNAFVIKFKDKISTIEHFIYIKFSSQNERIFPEFLPKKRTCDQLKDKVRVFAYFPKTSAIALQGPGV